LYLSLIDHIHDFTIILFLLSTLPCFFDDDLEQENRDGKKKERKCDWPYNDSIDIEACNCIS